MKKILLSVVFTLALSVGVQAQEGQPFTFVKSSILKIEQKAAIQRDYEYGDAELRKRMVGVFLIDSINSIVDYSSNKYMKISSFSPTEKFMMITDADYGQKNYRENLIIKNLKTKQLYAIMSYAIRTVQDYSNMGNEINGNGWLTKESPKELNQGEKELIAKYKALIKSANVNTSVLSSIQKKYITRGYFDSNKVNSVDKQIYNKNLKALKIKANKLVEIDQYEDKDDKAESKLTMPEIASLSDINNWNMNYYPIN